MSHIVQERASVHVRQEAFKVKSKKMPLVYMIKKKECLLWHGRTSRLSQDIHNSPETHTQIEEDWGGQWLESVASSL